MFHQIPQAVNKNEQPVDEVYMAEYDKVAETSMFDDFLKEVKYNFYCQRLASEKKFCQSAKENLFCI